MPVTIRPALLSEADLLGDIGFRAWEDSVFGELDAGRTDRKRLRDEFIEACIENNATTRVAVDGDVILGWGAREDNYVGDLWLLRIGRGRGAGTMLLAAMEAEMVEAGHDVVELETHAGNAAGVAFYLSRGFSVIWRGEKFSPSLGYAVEKLRFSKPLK